MQSPPEPPASARNLPRPVEDECVIVQGTPEQRLKNQAALEWFARREAAYARLRAGEKGSLEREWQAFKRAMNENHSGYRKPYGDG